MPQCGGHPAIDAVFGDKIYYFGTCFTVPMYPFAIQDYFGV